MQGPLDKQVNSRLEVDKVDPRAQSSIAEDDRARSQYMRALLQQGGAPSKRRAKGRIPRTLVQFWDDQSAIPSDVDECIASWRALEAQGFDRLLFDDETARDFIAENLDRCHSRAFARCRHPAMRSDYFRLCYLVVNGGVYIDADDVFIGGDCEALLLDGRLSCTRSVTTPPPSRWSQRKRFGPAT